MIDAKEIEKAIKIAVALFVLAGFFLGVIAGAAVCQLCF